MFREKDIRTRKNLTKLHNLKHINILDLIWKVFTNEVKKEIVSARLMGNQAFTP